MTVMVTVDDDLQAVLRDVEQGGPWQYSRTGRPLLAQGSVPFPLWGQNLTLIGGKTVSYEEIYRTQPWVAAAVNKRFKPIVRLPLKVYEINSQGDKQRVREGRLVDLVTKPWKRGSPAALKQRMFAPTYIHGNSVIAKDRPRPGAPPTGFRPLDWRQLEPLVRHGELIAWSTREFGPQEWFEPADVFHYHWWGPDGVLGVSPLQQLGVTIRVERAAQEYQENYLEHGATPPSALYLPHQIVANDEMRGKIEARMQNRHGGPQGGGRVAILPNDTEWKGIEVHTAQEAELVKQRQLAREEVAAVYDMPPTLIGNLDKATYSNIETQGGWLYTDILGPDLVLNEQEFKAQVIDDEPAFEGQFVEYDLAGVLRGDKLKEIQALREAIGTALLKPQEGRGVLNLPVYGDPNDAANPANKLYLPTNNLTPIEQAGENAGGSTGDEGAEARALAAAAAGNGNGHLSD